MVGQSAGAELGYRQQVTSRADDADVNARELRRLAKDIPALAQDFRSKLIALVSGLESHPNYEVKFLAIRLSFNDQYRKAKSKPGSKSRVMADATAA